MRRDVHRRPVFVPWQGVPGSFHSFLLSCFLCFISACTLTVPTIMQLSQTFSLFASILLLLCFADATPARLHRRFNKLISLPVKRHQPPPNNLHPLIVSEQLVNRGLLRLARMSGEPEPPREILERNLMRRVLSVEGVDGLERRFNRRSLDDTVVLDKRFNTYGVPSLAPAPAPVGNSLAASSKLPQNLAVTPGKTPAANNSLPLDIDGPDTSYLATIQIGTPPRDFSILMDSGSADFWVGSVDCKADTGRGGCGNHIFLGSALSSSFVDSNSPWSITYGSGQVNGTLIKDDVSIAGLALPGHSFGVATLESEQFFRNQVPFDGLMGLGKSTLSNQENLTPVEALAKAKLISGSIVSYKMGRVRDNNNDGLITFGGLDPSKFDAATLTTVPNADLRNGFWMAKLDGATVDGKSLGFQRRNAILDTGTTLGILPPADADSIHARIPGSFREGSNYVIPCNTTTVVSFAFGGRSFAIDPRDLSFLPLEDDGNFESGLCVSGFAAGDFGGPNTWLVGDTFLKNVYLSTDVEKDTISLAKLV
jgi:hypothetical protein